MLKWRDVYVQLEGYISSIGDIYAQLDRYICSVSEMYKYMLSIYMLSCRYMI